MLGKIGDAASLFKAKITKDDLQQKLIQVTSEENWQAPTNLLHQIANASYNYQKWQKISAFIWEKLQKKTTWRKILKTLQLVQFLLKNGPPSIISSFKYDIYHFRTFSDYQHYSDGNDRGEPIRERSKFIVELLSNDDFLEEEREKAETIRKKMAGISGNYGSYGSGGGSSTSSGSRYDSYSSNLYKKGETNDKMNQFSYYGEYGNNSSTLSKYKKEEKKGKVWDSEEQKPKERNTKAKEQTEEKKPFQKLAPKLVKPQAKKTQPKPVATTSIPQKTATTSNFVDEEFFGGNTKTNINNEKGEFNFQFTTETKATQQAPKVEPQQSKVQLATVVQPTMTTQQPQMVQQLQMVQQPQIVQQPQMFQQPQPVLTPQIQSMNMQPNYNQQMVQQPMYGNQQMQGMYGQYTQPNQMYGQNYMQTQFPQQYYPQQMGGYQQPYVQMNQPQVQHAQIQSHVQPQISQQISLQSEKKPEEQFGKFESGKQSTADNVKWLSTEEKGLIDFSDFSTEIKASNSSQPKPKQTGNNIKIDTWNW